MKFKIFITLWATFVLTLVASSFVYTNFLNAERLKLVDGQIESYASLLSHSDLIYREFDELTEAEEQIQEILGGYRIGLVLIIKNSKGQTLYKNLNAKKLHLDPSTKHEWQFTENEDNLIRVYTKRIPELNRVLQLGTVANIESISKLFFSRSQIWYFLLLVIVSAVLSWLLSTHLFKPLKKLGEDLNFITKQLKPSQFNSDLWDLRFRNSKAIHMFKNDEFSRLILSVQDLLMQVRLAFQTNKNHSARLAHEVNTPLSLIKNRIKQLESSSDKSLIPQIHNDIDRLADFVHRYLEYSESLNTPASKTDIFAIKLKPFLEQMEENLKPISENRLKVEGDSQATIFSNQHDLEHLLQNIITNALKYSPKERDVLLSFKEDEITILDQGAGIPRSVLDKLGAPFNIGNRDESKKSEQKGTGLGLAWVTAISKKYNWDLKIESNEGGTSFTVKFNSDLAG